MTNTTNQIDMFSSAGNLIAGERTLAVGTRVTVKRTGIGGTVKSFDADSYVEPMFEIATDDGYTAILRRGEIHTAHALSWSCVCATCIEARKTLGRAMRGA